MKVDHIRYYKSITEAMKDNGPKPFTKSDFVEVWMK